MHRHIAYLSVCASVWVAPLLLAACGDDGTERLSMCPGGRIESDKMGILRCADSPSKEDSAKTSDRPATTGNPAPPSDAAAGANAGPNAADSGNTASGGSWFCQQVQTACSCVSGPMASDTCATPRPTCCVEVKHDTATAQSCVCYPEGSQECTGAKASPALYTPVAACPPR